METQLVFIEDEIKMAKSFFNFLNLKDKIRSVKYLKDLAQTKELLSKKGFKRFYWVDIHLGKGKSLDEGIEVIRTIRAADPDGLIIVYSAYPTKRYACLEAGADLFFEKDPGTYEHDLMQIRRLINLEIAKMMKEQQEKNEDKDKDKDKKDDQQQQQQQPQPKPQDKINEALKNEQKKTMKEALKRKGGREENAGKW